MRRWPSSLNRQRGFCVKQDDKRELWRAIGAFGNIGFTLAGSVVVGLLFGRWADRQIDSFPWASLGGIILGVAAGFWGIYKQVTGKNEDNI